MHKSRKQEFWCNSISLGLATPGDGVGGGGHAYQKEKGGANEKRKSFNVETIKKLPPKSKCYCFSHSRASKIQNSQYF